MAYTPKSSNFVPNMVSSLYHIGLGDGSRQYGYIFANDGQSSNGMLEKSNVADKEKLIQYSSPSLTDRDFAYYPRSTQGDTSGGALQTIFIDATKFMDSDLDITTPSYLQLRSSWLRKQVTTASPTISVNQVIAFNGDIYFTFGESNGNVYQLGVTNNAAPTFGSPSAFSIIALFTDGASLFAANTGNVYWSTGPVATWNAISNGINGTANKWWMVDHGTGGRYGYYSVRSSFQDSLYKIDFNAARPVVPANQPQVPTGATNFYIVDIVPYQGGIAILTNDATASNGFDVWFHDQVNMTRIVRVEGYRPMGMCNSLGNLYVGAQDALTFGGPVLFQVGSSGIQAVARPAVPNLFTAGQQAGQPRANAEYVYWPVLLQQTPLGLTRGGAAVPRVLVYNTLTNAVSYLPNMDSFDLGNTFSNAPFFGNTDRAVHRQVVGFGAGVAFASQVLNTGTLQYQQVASQAQPVTYQPSGWMVSSSIDFQTPGISKRFRRVEVKHPPLKAGESITVKAFVDQDPLMFTPSLAPVPNTAQVTDNFVGSTVTLLPFSADTVGRSLYVATQLNAGTGNQTTPRVISSAVELGGTWVWDFTLDCSSRRRTLTTPKDDQGVNGKDLYFLLRNSYENGNNLTLFLANGLQYTVNIESLEGKNIAYLNHAQQGVKADEEWLVHVVLRQVVS